MFNINIIGVPKDTPTIFNLPTNLLLSSRCSCTCRCQRIWNYESRNRSWAKSMNEICRLCCLTIQDIRCHELSIPFFQFSLQFCHLVCREHCSGLLSILFDSFYDAASVSIPFCTHCINVSVGLTAAHLSRLLILTKLLHKTKVALHDSLLQTIDTIGESIGAISLTISQTSHLRHFIGVIKPSLNLSSPINALHKSNIQKSGVFREAFEDDSGFMIITLPFFAMPSSPKLLLYMQEAELYRKSHKWS